jgi:hypothetical protein
MECHHKIKIREMLQNKRAFEKRGNKRAFEKRGNTVRIPLLPSHVKLSQSTGKTTSYFLDRRHLDVEKHYFIHDPRTWPCFFLCSACLGYVNCKGKITLCEILCSQQIIRDGKYY